MRRLGTVLGAALLIFTLGGSMLPARERDMRLLHVTHFYSTGNPMASGDWPFVGAAACSYDLPLYSWVYLAGDAYECLDRGALGDGSAGFSWVDLYGVPAESWYGAWAYGDTEP